MSFPSDPEQAIKKGFENAEKNFVNSIKPKNLLSEYEHSGSCANVVIIIGKKIKLLLIFLIFFLFFFLDENVFCANVGDSRSVYSENKSNIINMLSKDHKPNCPDEKKRIVNAGGYIYQGMMNYANIPNIDLPWRIFPGRLSVRK